MSAVVSFGLEGVGDPGEVLVDDGTIVVSGTEFVVLSLEKWLPVGVTVVEVDKNVDLPPVSYFLSIKQEGIC